MVERLAEIEARIANLGDLREIMGAMRALASMRLAQAQGALPGVRRYAGMMDFALARGLALTGSPMSGHPPGEAGGHGPLAVVAFTSEHGFAGAYNDHVLDRAWGLIHGEQDRLLVVGSRGRLKAEERGCRVAYWQPMATHLDGVLDSVLRCSDELYGRLAEDGIQRVMLVHGCNHAGAQWNVETESVLPFDVPAVRQMKVVVPLIHLEPEEMFDHLVEEFVFTRLMQAALESLASENAARLTAMEAAHDNIENKLEALSQQARQQRQEEITTELLDVVVGAMAARKS
jgi:F-type H+-transporting ATPase subunit gamma